MTTADTDTPKRRNAVRPEIGAPLTTQLLDASSAFAERGVALARTTAENGLKVTDVLVTGTLGVAEDWAGASPAAAPVKVAMQTWSTTRDGIRELVLAV